MFRFIDQMEKKNVLMSPLKTRAAQAAKNIREDSSLLEVADHFLLQDRGSGSNPYLVKKKMRIGPIDLNGLTAVPKSQFRISLKIPPNSRFECSYGILRDRQIYWAKEGSRTAIFKIILRTPKKEMEILNQTINLPPMTTLESRFKKIDLSSWAGEKVRFDFVTEGDSQALAFWFNPVLYVAQPETKNIILISLDTLRADHLHCYGYGKPTSPNIDSLGQESAIFLNTYAPSSWTLPSHISLMTGLNTINHRVFSRELGLDPSIHTLAEYLKERGLYNVALTGGGYVSGFYGFNRGFESYNVTDAVADKDAAERLGQAAVRWIADNKDKSFFLFLHTYQIHEPYTPPVSYLKPFTEPGYEFNEIDMGRLRLNQEQRFAQLSEKMRQNFVSLYDGEIRYTDESLIRSLIAKLRALNLYDRTMIILTSDHGEEFYEHKSWLHNHSVYNEVIKVPLIIKFFQSQYAGKRIQDLVRIVDIMPTILDQVRISYPQDQFDGQSLLELLSDKKTKTRNSESVFISDLGSRSESKHIPMKVSINQGPYKFILNEPYSSEDLKYFTSPPPPLAETEVFDLVSDPGEKDNLAWKRQDLARELLRWLRAWYKPRTSVRAKKTKLSDDVLNQLKSLGYL